MIIETMSVPIVSSSSPSSGSSMVQTATATTNVDVSGGYNSFQFHPNTFQQGIVDVTSDGFLVSTPVPQDAYQPHFTRGYIERGTIYTQKGQVFQPQRALNVTVQYGSAYLGSEMQSNPSTGGFEPVNAQSPDIYIRVINYKKYMTEKQKDPRKGDDIMKMIAILQYLQPYHHDNIANIVDCVLADDFIFIVTEFGGEDLYNIVTSDAFKATCSENDRRKMFSQIVCALKFLEEVGIYHRDLKVENIVYNYKTGKVKLIDFGMAMFVPTMTIRQIEEELTLRGLQDMNPYPATYPSAVSAGEPIPLLIVHVGYVGTKNCMPPEMLGKKPLNGFAADRWSLGVVLFYMLNSNPPWTVALQGEQYFDKFIGQDLLIEALSVTPLSANAKNLLRQMLRSVDPSDRLSTQQILSHPWMTE